MDDVDQAGRSERSVDQIDVVVVGGGLAGLTAAATAAGDGARVVLVEAREALGGRARSDEAAGFVVNHGAHALYRTGAGTAVLRDLGVRFEGRMPRQRGVAWWIDGRRTPARHLAKAGGIDGLRAVHRLVRPGRARAGAYGQPLSEWLDRNVPARGRALAEMVVRTSCYAADFTDLDAGAALDQVARGARGVLYLDGGWQTLVSGLEAEAVKRGVEVLVGRAESVRKSDHGVVVALRGGRSVTARTVVVANGGPAHVDALLDRRSAAVARWASAARPVLAACLDVAVADVARRRPVSTYGLDEPVYAVDHAASARLAPAGGAVRHALYYEPDARPDVDHRGVLEAMVDAQDPGWRERAVSVVYRRRSVVAHDRVRPGLDRDMVPTVSVPDLEAVFVAGDWLTGHGMLADAPITSGAEAGRRAAEVARAAAAAHHAAAAGAGAGAGRG